MDLWRRGIRTPSGRGMVAALDRVAEIAGLGMDGLDLSAVPTRRVIELARYGLAAKAPKLARHPYPRRIATLLATVRRLEVTATDDALELFDTLMANELIGRAAKNADRETLRRHAGQARDTELLAAAPAADAATPPPRRTAHAARPRWSTPDRPATPASSSRAVANETYPYTVTISA